MVGEYGYLQVLGSNTSLLVGSGVARVFATRNALIFKRLVSNMMVVGCQLLWLSRILING